MAELMDHKKKKYKIMVLVTTLVRGGCELHLSNILPLLDRDKFHIEVFVIGSQSGVIADDMVQKGIYVYKPWFASQKKNVNHVVGYVRLLLVTLQLWWTLMRHRPQVLHCFLPLSYLLGTVVGLLAFVPVRIMSRRSQRTYQKKYPLLAWLERQFHKITPVLLGNSRKIIHELTYEEGVDPNKAFLIHNGVKTIAALNSEAKAKIYARYSLSSERFYFSCLANLIPYKGHQDMLHAFGLIKEKLPENWALLLVGRDDGIQANLEKLAADLGLNGHVQFLGSRADAQNFLLISDIGLLFSHQEGFSNAILENMACAVPMIVTDVGGNAEAVLDGQTGILVPAHDPNVQAEAILKLATHSTLRQKMGLAALERARKVFSLETCAAKYADIYEAVLSHHSAKALNELKLKAYDTSYITVP